MLDQSFSPENFRKILDYENRKGMFVEGRYFTDLEQLTHKIKSCNINIRKAKKKLDEKTYLKVKNKINERKEGLKIGKESRLLELLEKVSKNITENNFKVSITQNLSIDSKPIYIAEDIPENFFCLKQIQYNFRKLYKVKQSSRYSIVSQTKSLLDDDMPKYVIRTDISNFYETLDHSILLKKLNEENLLSFYSKRIVSQILSEYRSISGNDIGVPRGIGISAYLSELYMRDIDKDIAQLKGLIYYARYVDDIIAIFTPVIGENPQNHINKIDEILASKRLTRNISKTGEYDLTQFNSSYTFDYLGYNITFDNSQVKLRITTKKFNSYKAKIDKVIDTYINRAIYDEKLARKILIKRIRFLTGNTRLSNNKKNILIGVYYSNNLVTEDGQFHGLDAYLRYRLNQKISSAKLLLKLSVYSFHNGFKNRKFSPFTAKDLTKILEIF